MALATSNQFTVQIVAAGAQTALETLAASMSAGTWAELTTSNFSTMLLPNFVGGPNAGLSPIVEYCDKFAYDPIRKKIFLIGGARGDVDPAYQSGDTSQPDCKYISYDEATNTWSIPPTAPVNSAQHSYDHQCINPANGDYYYVEACEVQNPCRLWYRAAGTTTWVQQTGIFTTGASTGMAIEWFPEQDALYICDGGRDFQPRLWRRAAGSTTWTSQTIGTFPSDTIGLFSVFMRYSPQHQCLYFGGGSPGVNTSPNKLYRLSASGVITKVSDSPPVSLGVFGASGKQCIDPATGNLLYFTQPTGGLGTGRVWSFNGSTWTQHGTHPLGTPGLELLAVFERNSNAGVVTALNFSPGNSKVYLYKHVQQTSGFTFPTNAGSVSNANSIRFKFTGSALPPIYGTGGAGLAIFFKYRPSATTTVAPTGQSPAGYYTNYFWGNDDGAGALSTFLWSGGAANSYHGMHLYPIGGGASTTSHAWEISVEQIDWINYVNGSQAGPITKGSWRSQCAISKGASGAAKVHTYYTNLPSTDTANRLTWTTASSWGNVNPPSPALTFADAPWQPSVERAGGDMRGFIIFNGFEPSAAQAAAISALETDAQVLAYCAANSLTSFLWYLNMNPASASDISDKSGNGHNPAWFNANRPTWFVA